MKGVRIFVNIVAALALFNVRTEAALFINGGFESGLAGWTFSGEGDALVFEGPLGTLTPTQGSRFALLTNGPGERGGNRDTAILTSSPFQVNGGESINFDAAFLTEEFTGPLSEPDRLDWFSVMALPTDGSFPILLLSGDVSMSSFDLIPGGPVSAPDAASFFESKEFHFSVRVPPGQYRIQFIVGDAGDNTFDSGLLIDSVSGPAIPEPSTLALACVGFSGLIVRRALRMRRRSRKNSANNRNVFDTPQRLAGYEFIAHSEAT